ncbi:MAG: 4a-hydroxytetrahydrobiopterin dehydratase [Lautropia sp.]
MTRRLDDAALAQHLAALPRWRYTPDRGGVIGREFVFDDFGQAFSFMAELALFAERHDHHPEWSNVYNRVRIELTTHDANGVTAKDVDFARAADRCHDARRGGRG